MRDDVLVRGDPRVALAVHVDLPEVVASNGLQPRLFHRRRGPDFPLLHHDDVRNDIGPRRLAERLVWQAERAEELGTLVQVPAGGVVLTVERVARGDEHEEATRARKVDRLREVVVVDVACEGRALGRDERGIEHADLAERHVRDDQVEVVLGQDRVFQWRRLNERPLIELFRNRGGDGFLVHAVDARAALGADRAGHRAEEVARADGGLEDGPALEAEATCPKPCTRPYAKPLSGNAVKFMISS